MIKDTNEQPDDIQRVRPGRILSAGAPPLEAGVSPPRVETFSNVEALFTLYAHSWGLTEVFSHWHD